jgi:hypothetical protein
LKIKLKRKRKKIIKMSYYFTNDYNNYLQQQQPQQYSYAGYYPTSYSYYSQCSTTSSPPPPLPPQYNACYSQPNTLKTNTIRKNRVNKAKSVASNYSNKTIIKSPEPTAEPIQKQTQEGFEFIELKGIRGIWVKKDAGKDASILINNYMLDNNKEKVIEDCEPSEPLVIRESPPKPPKALSPKLITIPGRRLSPPARRVIIEKLPPQNQKVIVERWLPYEKQERQVIVQKAQDCNTCTVKPKNLIVEWEQPSARLGKKIEIIGVEQADPKEYVAKYGSTLKTKSELPQFALNVQGPNGINLNDTNKEHKLVGDVGGLRLVDLDKEGLSMYKKYLNR